MTAPATHPLVSGRAPSWASGWGQDPYGVFVSFRVGAVEQRMRWIYPGTFWMGSPENEVGRDGDEVHHLVTLTDGFWLAETPCTQALWVEVMGSNPSVFDTDDQHPAETVSWGDCGEFLEKLSERIPGLDPRLPTEAEWERACRAGTEEPRWSDDLASIAWYGSNSERGTKPVATRAANPWGLYDMLGNVWEWCSDWFGGYTIPAPPDPKGPERGSLRVVRGGSWVSDARFARAASRDWFPPSDRLSFLGFRLARGRGRGA